MSTTLSEFLREQAAKRHDELAKRQVILDEWRAAITNLLDTIRNWLRTSDPEGILKLEIGDCEIKEEGLGKYTVPYLEIRGLGRWVNILPKARFTVGRVHPPQKATPEQATGRVDITNEVRRYILYRVPRESGDLWLIDDLQGSSRVLDQEAFEAALMSYLR